MSQSKRYPPRRAHTSVATWTAASALVLAAGSAWAGGDELHVDDAQYEVDIEVWDPVTVTVGPDLTWDDPLFAGEPLPESYDVPQLTIEGEPDKLVNLELTGDLHDVDDKRPILEVKNGTDTFEMMLTAAFDFSKGPVELDSDGEYSYPIKVCDCPANGDQATTESPIPEDIRAGDYSATIEARVDYADF
ncbi:hypothetical protein LRF89_10375 [Halorhodospira sp. 9621]|uniref:hypothetical protein n=1 Tax=Halorhodospira sp. 9621 TaxID=2899135 RepID=UPI001EE87A5C|nr:hypothetical protein [Halorhodospira sp. 9621]MCG5533840.1 hypothetical protein [Halorhodospira sp. 9621]